MPARLEQFPQPTRPISYFGVLVATGMGDWEAMRRSPVSPAIHSSIRDPSRLRTLARIDKLRQSLY